MQDLISTDPTYRKHELDHADYAAPSRQHELDHTDHIDQESIGSERSRSFSGNRSYRSSVISQIIVKPLGPKVLSATVFIILRKRSLTKPGWDFQETKKFRSRDTELVKEKN